MKKYHLDVYYNWHTGFEVEADTPEEAWEKVRQKPWEEFVKDFDVNDLDFDFYTVYNENGECVL